MSIELAEDAEAAQAETQPSGVIAAVAFVVALCALVVGVAGLIMVSLRWDLAAEALAKAWPR